MGDHNIYFFIKFYIIKRNLRKELLHSIKNETLIPKILIGSLTTSSHRIKFKIPVEMLVRKNKNNINNSNNC